MRTKMTRRSKEDIVIKRNSMSMDSIAIIDRCSLVSSICIKKSSLFGFWFWLFLVLFGRSTFVCRFLLLIIEIAQSIVKSTNNKSCENTNVGEFDTWRQISNWKTKQFHFVSLFSSFFLLLFGFSFFLSNLILFVKLFNEFSNLILLLGSCKIVSYLAVVHAI